MGAWTPALYQDDIALDIKSLYETKLKEGKGTEIIVEEIKEELKHCIKDEDDGPVFWFI